MRRGLHWTNEDREKWIKVYTEAWVRLQEKYNPNWVTGTRRTYKLIK